MTQLQELVDSLSKPSESSQRRIEYFYVSRMPLECELQRMLADVFQSLGAINSALDVYIRLQWWDGVIACYQHLELKHKVGNGMIVPLLNRIIYNYFQNTGGRNCPTRTSKRRDTQTLVPFG